MAFNIKVETPKTPYCASFEYKLTKEDLAEQLRTHDDDYKLLGWRFRGQIWANEDSEFMTCIRLDDATNGWLTVEFAGGPDSFEETTYWGPEDVENFPVKAFIIDLLARRLNTPVIDFEKRDRFMW